MILSVKAKWFLYCPDISCSIINRSNHQKLILHHHCQQLVKWLIRTHEAEVQPPSYADAALPPSYSQCLRLQDSEPPGYHQVTLVSSLHLFPREKQSCMVGSAVGSFLCQLQTTSLQEILLLHLLSAI